MSNRSKNGHSSGQGKKPSALGKKPRPKKSGDGSIYVRDDAPRRDRPRQTDQTLPQLNKRLGEFEIDRLSHDGRGVGSSRVDLQACKLEYSIVSPK